MVALPVDAMQIQWYHGNLQVFRARGDSTTIVAREVLAKVVPLGAHRDRALQHCTRRSAAEHFSVVRGNLDGGRRTV